MRHRTIFQKFTAVLRRIVTGRKSFWFTYAIAVFPVPGWPPIKIARPAIFPSLIMLRITPAALLASCYTHRKNKIRLLSKDKNFLLSDINRCQSNHHQSCTSFTLGVKDSTILLLEVDLSQKTRFWARNKAFGLRLS